MVRPVEKILQDVLDLMEEFEYTENEDRPSNSFFEAELNEDGFFILRQEIRDYLVSAKNTEQLLQPDQSRLSKCYDYKSQKEIKMRTQDIVIGETYRHRDHPNYAYAKVIKIIRPMPEFKKKTAFGLTEEEKNVKCVYVKCEWVVSKNDSLGLIKYFRPCDLVKDV